MEGENGVRKWVIGCLTTILTIIVIMTATAWIIDPYFHFHKPFPFVSYRLYDERYTNDGISRHFEYDTIITGTSMAQNFKPSEVDAVFGVTSVKETFSGAGFKELSQNLDRALAKKNDLKTVIWSVDFNAIIRDKDYDIYSGYPKYLYDDNPFNDVCYIFNKTVWYEGIIPNLIMTLLGHERTSLDEYSAWDKELGYEHVMAGYDRWEERAEMRQGLSAEEQKMVEDNIRQNFVELVNKYPDTTFYLFYTPYSICWWDFMNQEGLMLQQFEAERITTELLLQCPNVKLYNFNDKYDVITEFDNYRDREHYGAHINSQILEWLAKGEGLVTLDNYEALLEQEKQFYLNYNYEEKLKNP